MIWLRWLIGMQLHEYPCKKHLNPNNPSQKGSAQNPDIFFQAREACNPYYDALPAIVQDVHGQS